MEPNDDCCDANANHDANADDGFHDAHDQHDADAHDEWHDADGDDDVQNDLLHDTHWHEMRDGIDGRIHERHVYGMLRADDDHDEHGHANNDDVRRHDDDVRYAGQDGESLNDRN